jgi:glycosyltransferase involved in cell wall biosynthesis
MATSGTSPARAVRVLFLHTATLPPLGADTWVHAQIMRALDRSSHVVHAACTKGRAGRPTPTYELLRTIPDLHLKTVDLGPELSAQRSPWSKLRALVATLPAIVGLLRLAVYIRRNRIDVIHTSDRPRDAFAAVVLARMTGARCIVQAHVAYGDWMSRLLTWSLARANSLIAVSQFVKRSLVASGLPADRTYVVLNAIDGHKWQPGRGRDDARRELGIAADSPVVITVCRLFPGKGPGELIQAMAIVRKEQPETTLLVVGHDPSPDGSYRRELVSLTEDLDLADCVVLTGRRSDVPRLMAAADVFAMPSLEEPFGLVYLEAMAMQLPVVALETGGTPEVVDGLSGLLCPPGDRDALAANIVELLSDPDRRARMGEHGRRQVDEWFTIERQGRDIAEVYRSLLSGGSADNEHYKGAGHASVV